MPFFPRSRLSLRLLEALSLALSLEQQAQPNPITQAALHHSVKDLIAEMQQAVDGASGEHPSIRESL
jgi:hypothetical protein